MFGIICVYPYQILSSTRERYSSNDVIPITKAADFYSSNFSPKYYLYIIFLPIKYLSPIHLDFHFYRYFFTTLLSYK